MAMPMAPVVPSCPCPLAPTTARVLAGLVGPALGGGTYGSDRIGHSCSPRVSRGLCHQIEGGGGAVPRAAIMLALRTALGFSLSCSLCEYAVFTPGSSAPHLECRIAAAAAVCNLSSHGELCGEERVGEGEGEGCCGCCRGGMSVALTTRIILMRRDATRAPAPAKLGPPKPFRRRHHRRAHDKQPPSPSPSPYRLSSPTRAPLRHQPAAAPPGNIPSSPHRLAASALCTPHAAPKPLSRRRRLTCRHALRNGPELGEVPEELRRRRGRGEEDHASHR
jgi:hypothetical protein